MCMGDRSCGQLLLLLSACSGAFGLSVFRSFCATRSTVGEPHSLCCLSAHCDRLFLPTWSADERNRHTCCGTSGATPASQGRLRNFLFYTSDAADEDDQ